MADWYGAFRDELYATVKAAWPEIQLPNVVNGVGHVFPQTLFTTIEALKLSIVEFAKVALAGTDPQKPIPPYAVVQIGNFTGVEDFGCSNSLKRAEVSIWYIEADIHGATQEYVNGKIYDLAVSIDGPAAVFQTFQAIEQASWNSSETDEFNASLPANSAVRLLAASCSWVPGFLVGDMAA